MVRSWEVRGVGNVCHALTCPLSPQLTFGRLGQVVEDKKPITLKDISEVGTSCVPPTPGDMGVTLVSHGASWRGPGMLVPAPSRLSLQEEHKQLSSMLGCEVTSMLCVPVISRATSQVVALACAFNKLSGER